MSYEEDVDNVALGEDILYSGAPSTTGASLADTWSLACSWAVPTGILCAWANLAPTATVTNGRALGGLAWDPIAASGVVVLFGGYNPSSGTYYSDTWSYNTVTNSWTNLAPIRNPGVRDLFGFASDANNLVTYALTGYSTAPPAGVQTDFWNYN